VNYRTVASFAHDERIVKRFDSYLEEPTRKGIGQANFIGLAYGFSQFTMLGVYAAVFYSGAEFLYHFDTDGVDVFTAMFGLIFGAFVAGQA